VDKTTGRFHSLLLVTFICIFIWSAIRPADRFTWWLEVFPTLIGIVLILSTYRTFRLTSLLYFLVCIHAIILLIGGHYTYAEVPLFNWIRDTYDLGRNHYDRLGHFAQGFIPAILVREILVRTSPLKDSSWLPILVVSVCLAFSALFELFEFAVAMATGTASEAFLATQGDVWDTQWDMFFALIGATISYLLLHRLHNHYLSKL
jgi:putative membrane protein